MHLPKEASLGADILRTVALKGRGQFCLLQHLVVRGQFGLSSLGWGRGILLVGRGPGRCETSYAAHGSPPTTKNDQAPMSVVG